MNTKNITVSVDQETYRKARIAAAERDTSVSALVRTFLRRLAHGESDMEFDRLRKLQDEALAAIRTRGAGLRSSDNLDRDDLHR